MSSLTKNKTKFKGSYTRVFGLGVFLVPLGTPPVPNILSVREVLTSSSEVLRIPGTADECVQGSHYLKGICAIHITVCTYIRYLQLL